MKLLEKIIYKKEDFNVVMQGCYHDNCKDTHYKLAKIDVPENALFIKEGSGRNYNLFRIPKEFKEKAKDSIKLDTSFSLGKGIVIGMEDSMMKMMLEWPMILYFNDGRIFVDRHILEDKEHYNYCIDPIVENTIRVAELFKDKKIKKYYLSWVH